MSTDNGNIAKFKRKIVAPSFQHQPDGVLRTIRGFVPIVKDWVKETTSECTMTVSLASQVSTSAVAVAVVQRLQDDAVNSFVEVTAKASVSTNSAAKARLVCNNTSSTGPQTAHAIIPVNSDREVMWQIYDAKSTAVQTASLGIVGFYI